MTTDNDAEKALDALYSLALGRPDNNIQATEYIARERNKVYAALTKSAKVDGILAGLKEIHSGNVRPIESKSSKCQHRKYPWEDCENCLSDYAGAIIQRYNGEG